MNGMINLMKKNIFIDLVDTLMVFPPIEKRIFWIKENYPQEYLFENEWVVNGFVYAAIAEKYSIQEEELRDDLLTKNFYSFDHLFEYIEEKYHIPAIDISLKRFTINYSCFLICNAELKKDALSFLEHYKNHNIYLVSNIMYPFNSIIRNIKEYFKDVFFSNEIKLKKPSKELLRLILFETASDVTSVVFIGDNWNSDIVPALSINMSTIYLDYNKFKTATYLSEQGLKSLISVDKFNKIKIKDCYKEAVIYNIPANSFENLEDIKITELAKNASGNITASLLKKNISVNSLTEIIEKDLLL